MDITAIINANPKTSLIIISIVVTFLSTMITKWLTNQTHLKELKARQKALQEEMKKHKGNNDKLMQLQTEALQITGTMMKSSFKPLFITFIPFLILLYWLRAVYVPLMGNGWIWWYIISSIVASMIFRKVFDIA